MPVPAYGIASEGCWAAVGVRGKKPATRMAFTSVYRPPGLALSNLVSRYGRTFGLLTAAVVHACLYAGLGVWLSRLREGGFGFEICIGGDFNADLECNRAQNRPGGRL